MQRAGKQPSQLIAIGFFCWALVVVATYVLTRSIDVQPVLWALGGRLLDLLVVLGTVSIHVLPAYAVVKKWGGIPNDPALKMLTVFGVATTSIMLLSIGLLSVGYFNTSTILLLPLSLSAVFYKSSRQLVEDWILCWSAMKKHLLSFPGMFSLVLLFFSLLMAWTPAVSQDAMVYHLALPKLFLAQGHFVELRGNAFSYFPQNFEMLFATGLGLRGEISAKLFHWLFAVACCLLIAKSAKDLAPRVNPSWASLAFLAIPSAFRVSSWAYVELGLIFFLLLSAKLFEQFRNGKVQHCALCGLFIGVACGIKYTALPLAAIVLALVIWQLRKQQRWLQLAPFLFFAMLGGGFWYIRNMFQVSNPVFPFFYEYLGGAGWDLTRHEALSNSLKEWGSLGVDLPWALTFDASFASVQNFDGIIGPQFLVLLPLLVYCAVKKPICRPLLMASTVLFLLWASSTRQIRFLLPCLACLTVLIPLVLDCFVLGWQKCASRTVAVLCILLSLISHSLLFCHDAPLAFAVGLEGRDSYRQRMFPGGDFMLLARIPEFLQEDSKILVAACGSPAFLIDGKFHYDPVVENHTLKSLLNHGVTPKGVVRLLQKEKFTHLLFRFELVFGKSGVISDLSLEEQKLLREVLNLYGKLQLSSSGTFLYQIRTKSSSQP